MSLDQQWCPTSVQVTVLQARGLRTKGKSGTNDAYAVMQVGKEKYQTSVVEKSVAPVWKEEAAFDLPPLHLGGGGGGGGGGELHVHVLHRALVGPDKQLGQAVINLLQLSEDKTRNKTEWFKLLDKTGKADKDRGEVLLDIQFMRNNMTASMFDLSTAGKSRSRLGKLKDKVRGRKKESDTVSSVVPSFSQVLTDSEDEANGEVAAGKDEKKKKNKMKSLFSPKSNLQKNMSQSMSILPGKNSSLSGSQSSGLNVDSSEGKKKFKFMIHKRSGSSDSKDSSSGHQKHGDVEQSNVCINGSHVYCEEPPSRTSRIGSNFSLASSGHGSMEDVPESSPPSVDSLRAMRQYSPWTEEEEEMAEVENTSEDVDELRREEEERIRIEEERRRKEEERERREEEERERLAEERRRLEEQERMRIEEEEKRQREERIREEEEEERRRKEEEEERRQKEALERLAEEKRRQEEEDRKRIEEEKERIQREEERKRWEEQERVKREEEERERLAEEKRRLEEQERRRIEEEEKRQREEEERIRVEEERAWEERRRQEEEERVRRQEEHKLAEEKRRLEEERRIEEAKVRKEEEERIRREEERAEEERRKEEEERVRREEEHEKKRRLEEQERRQREEKERIRKEEERKREEARKEKEEYERMVEEKRKLEEKERERIETEEKIRREEKERIRMEEERRRKEEEAERVKREEEECEEKRRLEEQERKRIEEERHREEEERIRKENEEYERLAEEKRRLEEEERRQKEEEERIREEEEERIRIEEERRRKEEEERARKEKEEMERLLEEKRRLEEERRQEEERIREEEEERIRIEEERRRQEEEERARKEKEEMERSAEEKRRLEEQEKRKIEEEERIRRVEKAERERKEEETKKLEKEKLARDAEEQKKRENKTKAAWQKLEVAVESPAHSTSTNPFDEDFSNNPFDEIPNSPTGPDSSTARVSDIQQGCQSAVLSVRSKTVSTEEKDLISTQREKRPAPQPPGRNQAESQREQDVATRHQAQINKQSNDKDIKTASVLPQRWTQMTSPLSQSPTDTKNTQSVMQSSSTKGTQSAAKHSKRPAPPRPRSVEEEPSSEPKTGNISQRGGSDTKQVPVVYGLNPFEDDDEDELTAQDDTKSPGNTGSIPWPPAVSPAADKDAASQAKLKSSKVAHAPPPPAKKAATSSTLIHQNTDVMDDADAVVPDNGANETCDPQPEAIISVPVQGTSVKEPQPARAQELPPTTSRRLQPVKPLNPPDQQSVSIVQGEKYNQSTGILSEIQERTKVNDTGLKGPYSQLTREELISLVLKQEKQLSERDKKISEMEQYIDNLLVRVMEEKPSILMSMNSLKKAV